jgi:hypothetical protein
MGLETLQHGSMMRPRMGFRQPPQTRKGGLYSCANEEIPMSVRHALGALAAACGLQAATLPSHAADVPEAGNPGAAAQRSATLHDLFQQERQRDNIYVVHFPDAPTARRAAISFHDALLESDLAQHALTLQLDDEDVARLAHDGYAMERATAFIARRNATLDVVERAGPGATLLGKRAVSGTDAATGLAIPGFPCYPTVEETEAAAQAIVAAHPALATWTDVGDSWEKVHGFGGHDIFVLKLTNHAITGTKPKLLITSAIHAREYTTAPIALAFAQQLADGYGTNADATWILDHHEIHFMLQVNPDGRKQAETGLLWRKNTDQAYCGATSVNRGADLNRNFEFSWNDTGGRGSSGAQCNETYRGPSAGSEPETQAIENYARAIFPDSRGPDKGDAAPADTPGMHIDLHSYADMVLWPWGDVNTPTGNGTALQTGGRHLAFFNQYEPTQSIGLYPTDGTSDGVSYGELGVANYTLEMGTSFFEGCTSYEATTKPRNLAALLYAARVVRTPYITPAGPDVGALKLKPAKAVSAGTLVTLSGSATDLVFNDTNGTQPTHPIGAVEYYVDVPPWLPGAVANPLAPADGSFDATVEAFTGKVSTAGWKKGKHLVYVRAQDAAGNWGAFSAIFLKTK